MLSFNNDAALKQQIIDHLNTIPVDDTLWKRTVLTWDGTAGSFVGHILKSEDLTAWENLGLPKWLALTLDCLLIMSFDLKADIETNIKILNAIPVGKDIQHLGSQYLIELVNHDEFGIRKSTQNETLLSALASIVEIHQQCLKNEDVSPATWRALRKKMVENSQQFEYESLESLISTFAEAAAWNPVNSRTAVSDSVRVWGRAQAKANPSPDWTPERDIHIRSLLDQLYQEAAKKRPEGSDEFINVFALLEDHSPEDADWVKGQVKWQNSQPAIFNGQAVKLLIQLLAQA